MHLFCPGRKLQIDYASESITLVGNGSEDRLDILVTNHSTSPVDRIHVLYPHPVPTKWGLFSEVGGLLDATETWVNPTLHINRFFREGELLTHLEPNAGEFTEPSGRNAISQYFAVLLCNPFKVHEKIAYRGWILPGSYITTFQLTDERSKLTKSEWKLLRKLGWSIFTVHFAHPILPQEPRWMRLRGINGMVKNSAILPLERSLRKMIGIHSDTHEIAGPIDLVYRLDEHLSTAAFVTGVTQYSLLPLKVADLHDRVIKRGIKAENTETVYKDYRINIFPKNHRIVHEPSFWGDILPVGALINSLKTNSGGAETAIQWKAGLGNIESFSNNGMFYTRIRTSDIPTVIYALPWLALVGTLFEQFLNRMLVILVLVLLIILCSWRRKPRIQELTDLRR